MLCERRFTSLLSAALVLTLAIDVVTADYRLAEVTRLYYSVFLNEVPVLDTRIDEFVTPPIVTSAPVKGDDDSSDKSESITVTNNDDTGDKRGSKKKAKRGPGRPRKTTGRGPGRPRKARNDGSPIDTLQDLLSGLKEQERANTELRSTLEKIRDLIDRVV